MARARSGAGMRANSKAANVCANRRRCSRSWSRKWWKRNWRGCMASNASTPVDRYTSNPLVYLCACLLVYLLIGLQYAALTPAWQVPDEPAHYNYIRHIAEHGVLPVLNVGDYDQTFLSQLNSQG